VQIGLGCFALGVTESNRPSQPVHLKEKAFHRLLAPCTPHGTAGDISLKDRSAELLESFPEAQG
jgi:hypothetical protein